MVTLEAQREGTQARPMSEPGQRLQDFNFSAESLQDFVPAGRCPRASGEPETPAVEPDVIPTVVPVPAPHEAPDFIPGIQPVPDADPVPDQCPIRQPTEP
jgi:hypothetical protein